MKLLILGAAGPTGRLLVSQALEAGHDVIAFVRDPAKMTETHAHLRVVKGDATDETAVAQAAAGVDAVLSALGSGLSLLRSDIVTRAARAILPAMKRAGVRRLVFLSAFGVGDSSQFATIGQRIFFRTFLRRIYADKAVADAMIRNSDLDWTLVYPVKLTDGPRTGKVQVTDRPEFRGLPKISRADVAEFMLREAAAGQWVGRTAMLAA